MEQETIPSAADYFGGREWIDRTFPRYHPMRDLLVVNDVTTTTLEAFNRVYKCGGQDWLKQAKQVLASIPNKSSMAVNDQSAYSSVFGELRAYADLLQISDYSVTSKGTGAPGPDFTLISNDGQAEFDVEVFTYPPRPDNVCNLGQFAHEEFLNVKQERCSLTMTVSVQDPFGFPDPNKENESTTANAISKICARKGSEEQLSADRTSLLYIDLQTLPMSYTMLEQTMPVLRQIDAITSGALWYAFYGRKGFPIFENAVSGDPRPESCVKMQHQGHFRWDVKSKANAILLSVGPNYREPQAKRLVCLENPEKLLPDSLRKLIMNLDVLDCSLSRMGKDISSQLKGDCRCIQEALDEYRAWYPNSAQGLKVF